MNGCIESVLQDHLDVFPLMRENMIHPACITGNSSTTGRKQEVSENVLDGVVDVVDNCLDDYSAVLDTE